MANRHVLNFWLIALLALCRLNCCTAFIPTTASRAQHNARQVLQPLHSSTTEEESTASANATSTSSSAFISDATSMTSTTTKVPAVSDASFGDVVSLKRPATASSSTSPDTPVSTSISSNDDADSTMTRLQSMKRRNIGVAIASITLAFANYFWQFSHPVTPIQLLASMEAQSAPITAIGTNSKPTVVDFWAPWCENCKVMAPTLHKVEEEYAGKVNFVMVNGDRPEAWPMIERFGVDAIPHMALISSEGDVETALIGPVPKSVLERDLDVLLENSGKAEKQPLPYQMLDVFANRPDLRRVKFNL